MKKHNHSIQNMWIMLVILLAIACAMVVGGLRIRKNRHLATAIVLNAEKVSTHLSTKYRYTTYNYEYTLLLDAKKDIQGTATFYHLILSGFAEGMQVKVLVPDDLTSDTSCIFYNKLRILYCYLLLVFSVILLVGLLLVKEYSELAAEKKRKLPKILQDGSKIWIVLFLTPFVINLYGLICLTGLSEYSGLLINRFKHTNKENIGTTIELGRYEQDGNKENGPEAIEWTVLCTESDRMLLVSNRILFYDFFNQKENGTAEWSDSTIRAYLNDTFYNAVFSEEEKEQIETMNIYTRYDNQLTKKKGYDYTVDCVILLSYDEYQTYIVKQKLSLEGDTIYAQQQNEAMFEYCTKRYETMFGNSKEEIAPP